MPRHSLHSLARHLGHPLAPAPDILATRALFLRALALIQLIAVLSLWWQLPGLFGQHGITPIADILTAVHKHWGTASWHVTPSLLLLDASDEALHALCAIATFAALGTLLGFAPRWLLGVFWLCWLSLCAASDEFLHYQWDSLLLEATLLAMLFAPHGIFRVQWSQPPTRLALWSLRWLLFRLYFLSGVVKLASHDPTWRDGTAMAFHYWTQPLPGPFSHFVAALPLWAHKLETAMTFFDELLLPLAMFLPRRFRLLGFLGLASLQVMIGLTGNYGYFNLLSLVLCLTLLDDKAWVTRLPLSLRLRMPVVQEIAPQLWRTVGQALVGVSLLLLATLAAFARVAPEELPGPLATFHDAAAPFRSTNAYGLFAHMTTERPVIQFEGSQDGEKWQEYTLPWQVGALEQRPGWVQPHMPRLDWELWFGALAHECRNAPWTLALARRLLQNEPSVLALFAKHPDFQPKYLRMTLWQYHLPTPEQRARGLFWQRDEAAAFCPNVTLDVRGRLVEADLPEE
jgi:hypothetical protein